MTVRPPNSIDKNNNFTWQNMGVAALLLSQAVSFLFFMCVCDSGCGAGVEPVSCYWKAAGLIPLVCMSKCPWARH